MCQEAFNDVHSSVANRSKEWKDRKCPLIETHTHLFRPCSVEQSEWK